MFDVRLPNGTIIREVPEGVTKAQIQQKAIAAGLAMPEDFGVAPEPEKGEGGRGFGGWAKDLGLSLLAGTTWVPQAVVGLADLAVNPIRAGFESLTGAEQQTFTQALANLGVDFKRAQESASNLKTEQSKQARENVNKAFEEGGLLNGLMALGTNPSTAIEAAMESAPSMAALAGVVRLAALRIYSAAAQAAPAEQAAVAGKAAVEAAMPRLAALSAATEGAQVAGQSASEFASEGTLSDREMAGSLGAGATTAGIGLIANRIGRAMGLEDVEAAFGANIGSPDGWVKRFLKGAARESLLEEGPQSTTEQMWQNFAEGKPITQGAGQAGVEGMVVGGLMGGGFNAVGGRRERPEETIDRIASADTVEDAMAGLENAVNFELQESSTPAAAPAFDMELERARLDDAMRAALKAQDEARESGDIRAWRQARLQLNAVQRELEALRGIEFTPSAPAVVQPTTTAPGAEIPGIDFQTPEQLEEARRRVVDFTPSGLTTSPLEPAPQSRPGAEIPAVDMPRTSNLSLVPRDAADTPAAVAVQAMEQAAPEQEWTTFPRETGTLAIPRAEMPQIKAEHRGALTQFLKGRGIEHTSETVPADSLLPTQAEFSPAKVRQAQEFEGGDRSILVSQEGYIVDGHHQWLARQGQDVDVIRINAPVEQVLEAAHDFPSSTVADGATAAAPVEAPTAQQAAPQTSSVATQPNATPEQIITEYAAQAKSLDALRSQVRGRFGREQMQELEPVIQAAWQGRAAPAAARQERPAADAPASDNLRYRANGQPFATERAAAVTAKLLNLEGVEPVQVEGGWALAPAGTPTMQPSGEQGAQGGATEATGSTAEFASANGQRSSPEEAEAIQRYSLPAETTFQPGRGPLASGKIIASYGRETSGPQDSVDAAARELAKFLEINERAQESEAARDVLAGEVAEKLRNGEKPTDVELRDLFGLDPKHTYVKQANVGWFLVKHMGVPRNKIKASLGKAGGVLTSDGGTKTDIVYPRRLHEVFGQQPPTKEPQPPPDKIEDFGEVLHGARKHMASVRERMDDLSDEGIAKSTLSELWPKPEIDAIEDPAQAATFHVIREQIPSKPRQSYKLKRWVEAVKQVRSLVRLASDMGFEQFSAEIRRRPELGSLVRKMDLLAQLDRKEWSRVGDVNRYTGEYRDARTNEMTKGSWFMVSIDGRHRYFNGKSEVSEIVEDVRGYLTPKETADISKFEIRQTRFGNDFFIMRVGDPEHRRLAQFKNLNEATKYRAEHTDELVAAWEAIKERDNVHKRDVRRQENAARVGKDRRHGKDVTPDQFSETFGFRGVQFGNWVQHGGERQELLNQAYDALLDLAEITGIPPRAISLNGDLGLAFGARGSGWASAHYEPGTIVINLTKTRGAGALAHEWFHALDHYFQRQRRPGADNTKAFVTYNPENYYENRMTGDRIPASEFEVMARGEKSPKGRRFIMSRFFRSDWELVEGVRPEVGAAFATLVEALDQSPMTARAVRLDKGGRGYWSSVIERAARSFENYVISRMADQGMRNDFLANVVPIEEFRRNPDRYPYLLDTEIKPVAEAFDNLFNTLQSRETERGAALFSKRMARDSATGMTVEQVREAIQKPMQALNQRAGIDVEVLQSVRDLPAAALEQADPNGRYQGAYHNGKVYLFADNIPNAREAMVTLAHELVGHKGILAGITRKGWNEIRSAIKRLESLRNRVAVDILQEVDSRYPNVDEDVRYMEFLAVAAERRERQGPVGRVLARVKAALRSWFRSLGFNLPVSESDLELMLQESERRLKEGEAAARNLPENPDIRFAQQGSPSVQRDWSQQLANQIASRRPDFAAKVKAPLVLRHLGLLENVSLTWSKLRAIMSKHRDVPASVFRDLPTLLADPKIIYRRGETSGKGWGETNVVIDALTEKGEPIMVGIARGEVRTITPLHNRGQHKTGMDKLGEEYAAGQILYARDKKALDEAGALMEAAPFLSEQSRVPLRGQSSRLKERVVMRADLVKRYGREGEEGPLFSQQAQQQRVHTLFSKPSVSDFQEENRQIREEHKTLWNKVKRELKRQLTPGGLLPASVFKEKIARDSRLAVVEFDAQHLIGRLEQAIREEYGVPVSELSERDMDALSQALGGAIPPSVKGKTLDALVAMRQHIDQQSREYVQILKEQMAAMSAQMDDGELALLQGFLDAGRVEPAVDTPAARAAATRQRSAILEAAKDQAKAIWGGGSQMQESLSRVAAMAEKIGLMETIAANEGKYVHRSYQAFDDPKWFEKVPDKVLNDAREYLIHQLMNRQDSFDDEGQPMTRAEAQRRARIIIEDILKEGTAYDSMEAFIRESKLGAKDLSVLKRRKQIAPEIRALLGEYKDPRLNFAKSVTKMGRLIWNQRFLDKVREDGMGTFLFTEDNRPPNTTKIAADGSEVYSPLNGLYAEREVVQAFKDALGKEQMASWYRNWVRFNGAVKFGKTVLSPTTAARNWQSAMFFSLANGHFDMRQMGKSVAVLKEYFTHAGDAEKLAYLRKLKELGVVYDTPYAGEMMRLLDDSQVENFFKGSRAEMGLKQSLNFAQKVYSVGDDWWKIIGFENEKAMLMKHGGMTEAAAEVEAAERVRNTYPTYSMIGRGVQQLRRFPLLGTFVSFPAEIIRTSFHILRYMHQDYQNPKLRPLAIKRGAGMLLAAGFAHALQALTKAMLGLDDDDEEAVRLQAAPWQKNSNLVFTGRDEKGNLQYIDISFLDPYNYWKRPINAILRGQPWEEAAVDVAAELLEPFFGTDITAGTIFEVLANKTDTGGRVFKETDSPAQQALDIADHLRKNLQPGIASNLERTFKALKGEVSPSGKQYKLSEEALGWAGWRVSTLDPKTALYYRSFEFGDAKSDASRTLTQVLADPNRVDPDEIYNALDLSMKMRQRAYNDMITMVNASRRSGLTDPQITATLQGSGVSQTDIRALLRGTVPPWIPTKQSEASAVRRAQAIMSPEQVKQIRERYRMAREAAVSR